MSVTSTAWSNWAGNQRSTPTRVASPGSAEEVAGLVRAARDGGHVLKPVGSGHSFTAVAATDGVHVRLDRMAAPVAVDRSARLVTVGAGMPLHRLNELLAGYGLALPNLGDIDRQTISGAISTGTHGTGADFGCLATFVDSLEIVTGTGEVLRCSAHENPDLLAAARVGLGALGVVTQVTLRCVDAFTLRADERPVPLRDALEGFDDLAAGNDHVEFYWFPYTERALLKRNNRVPADDRPLPRWRGWLDDELLSNTVFGAVCRVGRAAPSLVRPLNRVSAHALSAREYTARSDRVFCTSRRVRFVEMEYALPRAALPEAFAGLRRVVDGLPFPVAFPVEVRVAAADDAWLSMAYGRDSAFIAIHQYVGMPYEPYMRAFEDVCAALGGRPHWGKLHFRDAPSLASVYPRFADFLAVRDRLDPDRVFANGYLRTVLGD